MSRIGRSTQSSTRTAVTMEVFYTVFLRVHLRKAAQRRMERSRLLGGERSPPTATRSTLAGVLLPVALAVIVAKSSFLAFPRAALDSRSPTALLQMRLEQRVRAFARQQGGRQRLLKLATHRDRRRAIGARLTMLADPDEAVLRAQMGRGWTYRGDAHVGSSAGGPGMPLTASYAMTADDLKKQQFKKVVRQRQFEDFVVDGRTGRPIDLSDEEKKELKAHMMADEAKEQEDVMQRFPSVTFRGFALNFSGKDGGAELSHLCSSCRIIAQIDVVDVGLLVAQVVTSEAALIAVLDSFNSVCARSSVMQGRTDCSIHDFTRFARL